MKGLNLNNTFSWSRLQIFVNFFVVCLLSFSCVGTIEDKNTQTTKSAGAKIAPVSFEGIEDAVPVGHNKVDVLFYPASKPVQLVVALVLHVSAAEDGDDASKQKRGKRERRLYLRSLPRCK